MHYLMTVARRLTSFVFCIFACMAAYDPLGAHELSAEIDIDAPQPPDGAPLLALPGRKFPLDFAGGEFEVYNVPIQIKEVANSGLGTGLTIWDGVSVHCKQAAKAHVRHLANVLQSVVLAKYLQFSDFDLAGLTVLELGSGTGLVGITASVLGAPHVLLTDLEYTLNNTRESVKHNRGNLKGQVDTLELDWYGNFALPAPPSTTTTCVPCRFHPEKCTADLSKVRLIIAADVVWVESLIEALAQTLRFVSMAAQYKSAPAAVSAETTKYMEPPFDEEITTFLEADGEATVPCEEPEGALQYPVILLAHQTRSRASDVHFFGRMKELGFSSETIPHPEHHPAFQHPDINIFRMKYQGA